MDRGTHRQIWLALGSAGPYRIIYGPALSHLVGPIHLSQFHISNIYVGFSVESDLIFASEIHYEINEFEFIVYY